MFGNFIYFIIVLLIFTTYHPSEVTNFTGIETACLFAALILFFSGVSRILFRRLEHQIKKGTALFPDSRFTAIQLRLSVTAVVIFVVDIYFLNLPDYLSRIPLFKLIPTIPAMICLAIFIGYLSIVWAASYSSHRILYPTSPDRRSHVLSNISFSVPVIMPWLILSIIADVLQLLPCESLKRFLSTTEGELFYFFTFLVLISLIGPVMIQKFWRCNPLPHGPLRDRIAEVCRSAGVSYRNILLWPIFGGNMITAGVMGIIKRFRYILVTKALLHYLSPEELDSVIAHEIGHVKKKHLLFYVFFFIGYMVIAYSVFDFLIYFILFSSPGLWLILHSGYAQGTLVPILYSFIMIVFFIIYFRYFFGYFMRNFERQADAFVFSMFNTGVPLATTLRKISSAGNVSADKPNWHHFSIRQRIGFLERCESDRSLVVRHDRKVSRSITAFILALVLIGAGGYQLNYGETGENLSRKLVADFPMEEIEKTTENAALFAGLGDLYYSYQQYPKAIRAYTLALSITSDLPDVLNNLAWLFATCEESGYRDPKRALSLSQKATALKQTPEFFDTLAESYYINGEIEQAVDAEQKALSLSGNEKAYYESQLKKFQMAGSISGT